MKCATLAVLLVCCVAVVVFPIYIIRPFVHQSVATLSLALMVKRWAPWFTVVAFLAGAAVMVRAWARRGERFRAGKNVAMLALVAGLGLSVWASRINIYERVFVPVGIARFVAAADASLRPGDMVIAINLNGSARAYPILQMAYHHVLNDVVGGVPVVATY